MTRMKKTWKKMIGTLFAATVLLQAASVQAEGEMGYCGYIGQEDIQAQSIYSAEEEVLLKSGAVTDAVYRTENLPAVRNQGSYGTCWAMSILSLLEINMMQKGYSEADFSDMHLAYFSYYSAVDPIGGLQGDNYSYKDSGSSFLKKGGNFTMALSALTDWLGAADESLVPFDSELAKNMVVDGLPEEYAYQDVAYLKDYYAIDTDDILSMKQAIVDYGAVAISYYADGAFSSDSQYYKAKNAAYYCGDDLTENHGVVIVGWDDNFAVENFASKPSVKGAWIVRNSWDVNFGKDGYFYLSYADATISDTAIAVEAVDIEEYDNNYQYDGAIYSNTLMGHAYGDTENFGNYVKAANVFSTCANARGGENIVAVSFETAWANSSYQVEIYEWPRNPDNPVTGDLLASITGETTYVGKYTVELEEPIYMNEGYPFSVVVTLQAEPGNYAGIKAERSAEYSFISSTASAKSGQSYLFDGDTGLWVDYGKKNNANIRIKAYTENVALQIDPTDINTVWVTEDGYKYKFLTNGTVTVVGYKGTDTSVTIPSEIGGKKVTRVDLDWTTPYNDNYGNTYTAGVFHTLKEIVIPEGVTAIGDYTFAACDKLERITIPDTVVSIGKAAFWRCYALEEVKIPEGVTIIEEKAFAACTHIKKLTLPQSLTRIDASAFYYCYSLTELSIPDSVTTIGDYAFLSCFNMKKIDLPDSLTHIGLETFMGCAFTEIDLPKGLVRIGERAFSGCPVTAVVIPEGVTEIGAAAFLLCDDLQTLSIPASVNSILLRDKDGIEVLPCSRDTLLKVVKDSYAQDFAKKNAYAYAFIMPDGLYTEADGNWYYHKNDAIDFSYTGLASNKHGWWYVENGKVNFNYTGLASNEYGWWMVVNSAVDFGYTGLVQNEYGWWMVVNGAVDFSYTGLVSNEYGWWMVANGGIDFGYTGLTANEYGWWMVVNGGIDFGYTGLAQNEYGWWYVTEGCIDFSYTGLVSNEHGWWYVAEGCIDFSYTGLASNEYGWWMVVNGGINFDYSGTVEYNSITYNVVNGAVMW